MEVDGAPSTQVEVHAGQGRFKVRLLLEDTGRGWVGSLTGGESPHVGGVVLAVPRPSLADVGKASCDVYSVPVPGHLDNEVGLPMARALCRAVGEPVALGCGIHIEHADPADLQEIRDNCLVAQENFIERVGQGRKRSFDGGR
ncbi:prenylated flavin chaperone LpdD [Rubneribacter sp.]